jgi:hypothetical protein
LTSMEITCGGCGARFRLDPALLKDSHAARIRCRKCGGPIVVRLHEESPVPPVPEAPPEMPRAEPEPARTVPPRRASSRSTLPILSALCVLLLAAAALYFGIPKSGREMLGTLFAGRGPGRTGSAPAKPVYDIRNVKWSIEKETASGTLFVVRGAVANVGNVPSAGVRLQATLLGKDNVALAEQAAFAGNLIDEASLRRMDRPGIEGAMSNRFGEGNANREVPPGKAVPFMVLFFNPPVEIDAVMVKAIDAR